MKHQMEMLSLIYNSSYFIIIFILFSYSYLRILSFFLSFLTPWALVQSRGLKYYSYLMIPKGHLQYKYFP